MEKRPKAVLSKEWAACEAERYRRALFDDCAMWWLRHSVDRECGGFYCYLDRMGRPYAGDKATWPIGRLVWMFSHLCNNYERRDDWTAAAQHGAEFLLRHAIAEDNTVCFRMTRDGRPLASRDTLNTACFAVMGLAEFSKVGGDVSMWERAVRIYEKVRPQLGGIVDTPLLGYPINVQFHLHAHDMIRMTVASVLNEIHAEQRWEDDLALSWKSIIDRHWKPDIPAFLENVAPDGSVLLDCPEGRLIHPGHAMESAWMLMEIARRQNNADLMKNAANITLNSLQRGWDEAFGGVRYLLNIDNSPTYPAHPADVKLWWVHVEALYAALAGWLWAGCDELGMWYERIRDYSFAHFPDQIYGEWYGYLNRDGTVIHTAKADGIKGFFHLPRILFRCYRLLIGIASGG